MNQPQTDPIGWRYIGLFFAITIPLAWIFWIPLALIQRAVWQPPVHVPIIVWSTLGALSPLVALHLLQRASRGKIRLASTLENVRLGEWRSGWCLASPFVMVGIHLAMVLLYFGIEAARGAGWGEVQLFRPDVFATLGWWILPIILLHFFPALLTSPLFEEPGWRGFAFDHLSRLVPRDLASLTVGSYWWLWHQGMNVAFGLMPSAFGYTSMLLDSFTIDALYTLSRRNLLAAMLAHQAMGTIFTFLYPIPALWHVLVVKVVAVAILRYQIHRYSSP